MILILIILLILIIIFKIEKFTDDIESINNIDSIFNTNNVNLGNLLINNNFESRTNLIASGYKSINPININANSYYDFIPNKIGIYLFTMENNPVVNVSSSYLFYFISISHTNNNTKVVHGYFPHKYTDLDPDGVPYTATQIYPKNKSSSFDVEYDSSLRRFRFRNNTVYGAQLVYTLFNNI